MEIVIPSANIERKLAKRGISLEDCVECFENRTASFLEDTRERHQTNPKTLWFIAETNMGRLLKVVFIPFLDIGEIHIKSAFEPNSTEITLYRGAG